MAGAGADAGWPRSAGISDATQIIPKQIRLILTANKEHSAGAGRLLGQLKSVRAISDRNGQVARETRENTGHLVSHAEALRAALGGNSSNGRHRRGNGTPRT